MRASRAADVVVVGGGPGGAAAAIVCARAGLRCVLLDPGPGPGGSPGETLHPGVEVVLRRLGVAGAVERAGFLRHDGHWVEWAGAPERQRFGADADGPWLGFQAPREVLDPLLVDAAEEAGAQVLHGCRARAALTDGAPRARVTGVVTTAGPVLADVVIDATGRRHWLARELGLPIRRRSPALVVAYGYTEGTAGEVPRLRAGQDGWTWTAPVTATRTSWMRLTLHHDPATWRRLPAELAGSRPSRATRGADVTWRSVERAAGPGWFLVGDAAAVVDPGASHGVLRALMSGATAARAVVDRAAGTVTEARAAAGYSRWISDWFAHDTARLDELYRIFPSWPGTAPT